MAKFTDIDQSIEIDGFTLTARTERDDSSDAPWEGECGHGPVCDGTRDGKLPGQLVLFEDRHNWKRLYDFAEACRIARRDGWGVPAYRVDIEQGANGLRRAVGQWFEGRELLTFTSEWHDAESDPVADIYAQHRATMTPRQYAATAARADFERLKAWCDDEWQYVGVIVTVERAGVELASASLWGIESDAGDYLVTVANELVSEALDEARGKIAALTA